MSFFVEFSVHLGCTEVKLRQAWLIQYLKQGGLDTFHTWHVDALYSVEEARHFWWRSMVIRGVQWLNSENMIKTICQSTEGKHG